MMLCADVGLPTDASIAKFLLNGQAKIRHAILRIAFQITARRSYLRLCCVFPEKICCCAWNFFFFLKSGEGGSFLKFRQILRCTFKLFYDKKNKKTLVKHTTYLKLYKIRKINVGTRNATILLFSNRNDTNTLIRVLADTKYQCQYF